MNKTFATTAAAILILAAGLPATTWAAGRTKANEGYSAALPGGSTAVAPWSRNGTSALPGGANEGASTGEGGQGGAWYVDDQNDRPVKRAKRNSAGTR